MENTLRFYHTLVRVLSQHRNWLDVRHLKTLAWMMISLTAWAPYVPRPLRAKHGASFRSLVERFPDRGIPARSVGTGSKLRSARGGS